MRPIATHVVHSVVCVCLCVGYIPMSSAKTAEPIEMPFGGRLVGLGNLDDSTHTNSQLFHVACASIILLSTRTPQRITQSMGSFIVWYLPDGATADVEAWICRNAPWRGQCSVVVRPVAKLVCSLFCYPRSCQCFFLSAALLKVFGWYTVYAKALRSLYASVRYITKSLYIRPKLIRRIPRLA